MSETRESNSSKRRRLDLDANKSGSNGKAMSGHHEVGSSASAAPTSNPISRNAQDPEKGCAEPRKDPPKKPNSIRGRSEENTEIQKIIPPKKLDRVWGKNEKNKDTQKTQIYLPKSRTVFGGKVKNLRTTLKPHALPISPTMFGEKVGKVRTIKHSLPGRTQHHRCARYARRWRYTLVRFQHGCPLSGRKHGENRHKIRPVFLIQTR